MTEKVNSSGGNGTDLCYVIGSLQIGGAERHLLQITPELQIRGIRLCIYCMSRLDALAPQFKAKNITVVAPPLGNLKNASPRILRPIFFLLSLCKLWWVLRQMKPAICHFFLPEAYVFGAPIARLAGCKTLLMSRRSLNFYHKHRPIIAFMERRLHTYMKALIGNSLAVMRQLHVEGAAPEHTHIIYNGYSRPKVSRKEEYAKLKNHLGIPDDALILTVVANFIPYKGHADLIDALRGIKNSMPNNWRLLLVGRDDGLGKFLHTKIHEYDLSDNILFLGARNDTAKIFAASDIALLCSHEEGFSNAIIEAMAAGLPVIATDVGGNPEAIIDNLTGLLVKPFDTEQLGKAILKLTRDSALRKELGIAASKRFSDNFTLEQCVVKYATLYKKFLD